MNLYPDRSLAEKLLNEAEKLNPGLWVAHVRTAALCAGSLAAAAGMDADKAWVLGLLHDIGLRCGPSEFRHTLEGFQFLQGLGYPAAARICLTHSLPVADVQYYSGKLDVPDQDIEFVQGYVQQTPYDDYDRLIQLCDALSLPAGIVLMEKRLFDVTSRHGFKQTTLAKWHKFVEIRQYFDEKVGGSIYQYLPNVIENTFGFAIGSSKKLEEADC